MAASIALPLPDTAEAGGHGRTIARVRVFDDPDAAREAWDDLVQRAPCSPYQTSAWLLPWIATIGASLRPLFVLAFDHDGTVVAVLPLGLSRHAGLTVASFLGGRDSNTGLGLFHPELRLDRDSVRALLTGAAVEAGIDLFALRNQPYRWDGRPNPLATLEPRPSASSNHCGRLSATAPFLPFSKKTRKRLRWKESGLQALGPVRHDVAGRDRTAGSILAAYVDQRGRRRRQAGYTADHRRDAALCRFLALASRPEPRDGQLPAVELHALRCGERVAATFAGAGHGDRYSGMLVSFNADPDLARYGPGEVLIARVMEQKRQAGYWTFDLGIGEAAYKDALCPETEPLFDTVLGTTPGGRVAAMVLVALLRAKRVVKRTPWLRRSAMRLRRLIQAAAP